MSAPTLPPPTRSTGWADLAVRSLGPTRGWRPALRMALRDLRRHPGRTAAAAAMVLAPVMLASAVAAALATLDVSWQEERLAQMGSAGAVVRYDETVSAPEQAYTADQVAALVGEDVVEVRRGGVPEVGAGDRSTRGTSYVATDFTSPLTHGLVSLRDGRLPADPTEVALSPGLADRLGVTVGDDVELEGVPRTVAGLAVDRWASPASHLVLAVPASITPDPRDRLATSWLVDAEPLSWTLDEPADGLRLVDRRDVADDTTEEFGLGGVVGLGGDSLVFLTVAIALVVLEIALLAGPAFAVSVRQQQHTLALVAATGGDERALRRIVLSQGLVVGVTAATAGVVLGTGLAAAALGAARYQVDLAVGPVEVLWPLVLLFLAIGVVAALASALVPAVTASRTTVVGALAPRPSGRRLPWRRPLGGLALIGLGTLLLVVASAGRSDAVVSGSAGVLLLGIGMVLVVPLPVALLARITARAPLGLRLAGRESTRAASRSVAAVAAVAGASAALVAGLSLTTAVRAEDAARYVPRTEYGVTTIFADSTVRTDEVLAAVERAAPGATVGRGGDVRFSYAEDGGSSVLFWLPTSDCPVLPQQDEFSGPCSYGWQADTDGSVELHDVTSARLRGLDLTPEQLDVLAAGGALVADGLPVQGVGAALPVGVVTERWDAEAPASLEGPTTTTVPSARFTSPTGHVAATLPVLVLSPAAGEALGLAAPDVAVLPEGVTGQSSPEEVLALSEPVVQAVSAVSDRGLVLTEVGYRDRLRVVDWFVVGAAALVLLGATFTATALALADARRDRTVLTAVGASPRTQRVTAGGTAALIAGTGALVGGLVGFIPGFVVGSAALEPSVVSYGLGLAGGPELEQSLLALLPWGWFAVVLVGLPLLAGLVVALAARGRPDAEAARLSARVG